eukprot:SM000044S16046  [mRNA]  locus=s44:698015:706548:+ [translate_table: standard]
MAALRLALKVSMDTRKTTTFRRVADPSTKARAPVHGNSSFALPVRFEKEISHRQTKMPSSSRGLLYRVFTSGSSTSVHVNLQTQEVETAGSDSSLCRLHYHRKDGKYDKWGLHLWGDSKIKTDWSEPLLPDGEDAYGAYWDVAVAEGGDLIDFLIHQGDAKDVGGQMSTSSANEVWVVSQRPSLFVTEPDLTALPQGNLALAKAFWVTEELLAWDIPNEAAKVELCMSKTASLELSGKGVQGADTCITLTHDPAGLPNEVVKKFPHIAKLSVLRLPSGTDVPNLLKSQLAIAATDAEGKPVDATGIQLPGVLDDLYAYDGPLGATISDNAVCLHVWAPTAQAVRVLLYSGAGADNEEEVINMKESSGVWSIEGPRTWLGKYYLYEVTVFHNMTNKIEICRSTDPYSRGLTANGGKSLIVDLQDSTLKPEGWDDLQDTKPAFTVPNDISIYELHIRDFSAYDTTLEPGLRGTYLAFDSQDSAGMRHLGGLVKAGLSHVHLLPSFDFSTVDERKENWKTVDEAHLATLPPDSEEQQAAVVAVQDDDAFNWGYDPVHWGVPEGSYASDPDGPARNLEFRKMVQSLNRLHLRVVLDVVYNHIHGSGPSDPYSNLDKMVPGYYLRRNLEGYVEASTCMNNTACEHYMMERLVIDDLKMWATQYKVDGFRFDLMGHLMKRTLVRAKEELQILTKEKDGVDGSSLYLYGEGWDFGEVANNARGVNAAQLNLAGTGIGSFNDRIRDTAMGGSPFGDPQQQGFLTGLLLQPNELDQGDEAQMARSLASQCDWIRVGLVGNLRDYVLTNFEGKEVKGCEVVTHDGVPVGYTASPEEVVNYVSAHDNESLFDVILMKTALEVSLEQRIRINHMATSLVAFSQGVAFLHAGDDMLRSKSLDRDSYNSGDWFNKLDYSYESNNFGVGLPPKGKNESKWPIMRKLLQDAALKPSKEQILESVSVVKELLSIRYSSPLFRLRSASSIQARLRFLNTGPSWIPGAIIMSIEDGDEGKPGLTQLDRNFRRIVTVWNARPDKLSLQLPPLRGMTLVLHPIQAAGTDDTVKSSTFDESTATISVPARTVAVFVEGR